MRKLFGELRKLFGELLVRGLKPLFRRLHSILLLSLAPAQESAEERSNHKRQEDEWELVFPGVLLARFPSFLGFINIGKVWGFWIGSIFRRRV